MNAVGSFFRDPAFERSALDTAKRTPLLICGGRGLGKTRLLLALENELKTTLTSIRLIDGRHGAEERTQVLRIDESSPRAILVDNLDVLVTPANKAEMPLVEDVIGKLQSLLSRSKESPEKTIVIATSTIDPSGPLLVRLAGNLEGEEASNHLDSLTRLANRFHNTRLDPWEGDWRDRWKRRFDEAFEEQLPVALLILWRATIEELTGGHPSLTGPAVSMLSELCAERDAGRLDVNLVKSRLVGRHVMSSENVRQDVRLILEDLLSHGGLSPIRSCLRRLKHSQDPLQSISYSQLVSIAENNGVAMDLNDARVRNILRDEGLIYRDDRPGEGYVFRVPGELIVQEILHRPDATTDAMSLMPNESNVSGYFIFRRNGLEVARVHISGTPWQLLRALHSGEGRFLSNRDLQMKAGLDNEKAVQNAVQRLRRELSFHNLKHLIESEYNKGYRIAPVVAVGL